MSVSVEKLEKSMAKLTIEVSAEDLDKAANVVYNKQKGQMNIPGFRRGKAPRKVIEKMYGPYIFLQDAANDMINATYPDAAKESGEDITSSPEIGLVQLEPGKPFIYSATVAVKPPVTLGQYKGVEVPKAEAPEATDEEVEAELKRQQDQNAKTVDVTDRAVKDGDEIVLDFAGSVDGVPFDGGTAADYPLTIGSGSFIPGFEEQLIGKEIGQETDVNVTFPENYQAADLAGKPAVFRCTVKSIKEKQLPELNDEFADEVSEFSTLAELKEDIKKNIIDRKVKANRVDKENAAVDAASEAAQIEIPEAMIKTQQQNMADEFGQNMQMQGLKFDDYLKYTGMTMDQFVEQMKPQAEKRIRTRLTLEQIVKEENITVTDEDLDAEFAKMAEQYKMPVDNVKKIFEEDQMKEDLKKDIAVQKAVTLIADAAVEVEKAAEAAE